MKRDYIKALDGVRGFALLLVVLSHAALYEMHPIGSRFSFQGAGRHGVFVFFVLSAFLLTKQFLDTSLTRQNLVPHLFEYFFRRVARIYPLYLFALFVYWSPSLVLGEGLYFDELSQVAESAFLYHGYSIFWTIPVEFTYYLILPIVALFIITFARNRWLMYGALLGVIVVTAASFPRTYDRGFMPFVFIFLMGSVVAAFHTDLERYFDGPAARARTARVVADLLAFAALVALFFHIPAYHNLVMDTDYVPAQFQNYFFTLGLIASLLVFFTINGRGWVCRFFESRPLLFVGKVSFSAYVWHMIVLRVWEKVTPFANGQLNFLVFLAMTLCVAYVSYRVFERWLYRSTKLRHGWDALARRWV